MLTLCNAFSLSMLPSNVEVIDLQVTKLTLEEARGFLQSEPFASFVGHADTAKILENLLGVSVPVSRSSFNAPNARMIVAQYIGPRLPEGATTLPEGARIEFKGVTWGC